MSEGMNVELTQHTTNAHTQTLTLKIEMKKEH